MKITPFDENGFKMDHPRGTVSFNYLLMGGEPEKLENFRYILGRQEGDFSMPRHRHTFEQIRLPLIGDMNLGEQGILKEGEVGYFPEGGTYGPQNDPLTDPNQLQLVLQFGGAAGLGMAAARGRGPEARRDGVVFRQERTEVTFPRPRYKNVVIMDPTVYNWIPVEGAPGVSRRYLGAFTERAFWIEFIKIDAGATWTNKTDAGRQLMVLMSGQGTVDGTGIGKLAALQVEAKETLSFTASEETVIYNVGLPMIELPETPSDQFDIVRSNGGIDFERKSKPATV
ncbi:hypothetical protein [Rhodococcus sp. NPDC060176]|uniref:hypothetical protein n=1 Tax=Rhodococcus sp. NPDC060176 TaxID=3347062 RepID=UPI0036554F14